MKQVLQNNRNGELSVVEVPLPALQRGRLLVRTAASLISAGTERAVVEMGQKTLVGRARERPDLVKRVIQKARDQGLVNTVNALRAKLESARALGYSAAGIVMAIGEGVEGFRVGERIACAGVGFASHAEVLSVPRNLCVHLPEEVGFEEGAFGTVGAIALQGVRLAEPTLGEFVTVIGLGLLGQITVQLLKANGCRVFGVDLDPDKAKLAADLGADASGVSGPDSREKILEWSRGRGADAVLITAATSSNEPLELAGQISRSKGRVVAVGVVGLAVPRETYYQRELTLKISMSYGPGRYDPEYEERGHDYPFGYVRWTENRNIEAFLDLLAQRRVQVDRLITHRFSIDEGERAYQLITGEVKEPYLGVLISYDTQRELTSKIELRKTSKAGPAVESSVRLGVIGAGGYVEGMLLPHFQAAAAQFISLATASGLSALNVGRKYRFSKAVSGPEEIIADQNVNLILIGTRHDLHASLARRVLELDRHVFVEKPLALNDAELDGLLATAANSAGRLMVGFNRRFSPLARRAKEFFAHRGVPLSILYRVNAGAIPREHWIHDPAEGGGRIVGEVCHFVDLMQFWIEAPPVSVFAESTTSNSDQVVDEDSVFITLKFADGSTGCIAYLAEGDKSLAKERVEILGGGKAVIIDDFRRVSFYHRGRETEVKFRAQDKGQAEEVRAVCETVITGGPAPISLEELAATTRATFRILDSLRLGQPVSIAR